MGSVRSGVLIMLLLLSVFSCSLLEKGYDDTNNQYVPKRPRFKLKDKSHNIIPNNLDTLNLYRLVEKHHGGKQVYPNNSFYKENYSYSEYNKRKIYIKFYPNGRCLSFSIPSQDNFGNDNSLKESDLNPNNSYYKKEYYYSKDGKKISIESFVYGQGYGMYVTFDYFLNVSGDTLTKIYKESKDIYVKKKLPANWKKYKVNW